MGIFSVSILESSVTFFECGTARLPAINEDTKMVFLCRWHILIYSDGKFRQLNNKSLNLNTQSELEIPRHGQRPFYVNNI